MPLPAPRKSQHQEAGTPQIQSHQNSNPPQIRLRTRGRGRSQGPSASGRCRTSSTHSTRGRGRGRATSRNSRTFASEDAIQVARRIQLPPSSQCQHCSAFKFGFESPGFCCAGGAVSLPQAAYPPELVRLFTSQDEDAVHFQK